MTNKERAAKIVELVGGAENVESLTHCVTRLRFVLKDKSLVRMDEIGAIDGVLKAFESGGQIQVVIGPGVAELFEVTAPLVGNAIKPKAQSDNSSEKTRGVKGILKAALDTLIACFVPAIPVIAGSGMIKVIVVLLQTVGVFGDGSTTAAVLNAMGDGVFYFLPFFVAYNAAKKMNVDVLLSMVIAAIVLHPNLSALGEAGTTISFIGMPMRIVEYSTQALPLIFAVWLLKYVDKYTKKYTPDIVKVFLRLY